MTTALRGGLQIAERHPGAGDGVPGMNLQASELFDGEDPASQRNTAAGNARAPGRDGDRYAGRGSFPERRHHGGFIHRKQKARGMPAEARSILQVSRRYTSRITGMISGRRCVSFTM